MLRVIYQGNVEIVDAVNDVKSTYKLRRTWGESLEVSQAECEVMLEVDE